MKSKVDMVDLKQGPGKAQPDIFQMQDIFKLSPWFQRYFRSLYVGATDLKA